MRTELDKIPSTITISMGLKNRIRKLKGNRTYEEYLSQLIRMRHKDTHSVNKIEITEFERKSLTYFDYGYNILFDYNKLIASTNHIFDIRIKRVIEKGKEISFNEMVNKIKMRREKQEIKKNSKTINAISYEIYFQLLHICIKEETKISFKHKSRIEDYDAWQQEFQNLGLSKKAYEYDVRDKLVDYESGVAFK